MEAEKFRNASQRTRKTCGIILSESKSLRIWQRGWWLSPHLNQKAQELIYTISEGKKRWMSQLQLREQIHPSFAFLFCSGPPHWWGWSSLLSLLSQMLISFRDILTDTLRIHVLPATRASLSPVKLIHKINHHSRDSQALGNETVLPKTFPKGSEIQPTWNSVLLS